jgi:3-hydroxyisobutyrate dehydrogenase
MQKVALIGLGVMGSGMAANWLKKGFGLSIYNRTRGKADAFAKDGARVAASPREAAEGADVIVAMVADDAASRGVWLGADGALAGAKKGAVAVEMSTLTPDWVKELAAAAKAKGIGFLDAPVGGSKAAAAGGQLVLFVGGDKAALDQARPALEAVSGKINLLGPAGTGATWKLINNLLVAVHVAALAEALALAKKTGFDPNVAAELIKASASASPAVATKLPRMVESRYGETDFALKHMLKDTRYALALARQHGIDLSLVAPTTRLLEKAAAMDKGDLDFAVVAEAV